MLGYNETSKLKVFKKSNKVLRYPSNLKKKNTYIDHKYGLILIRRSNNE